MSSRGPLALLGGVEHGPDCPPIDRWLLDRIGVARPRVTVIPAASPRHTLRRTGSHARRYWQGLGAKVHVGSPFAGPDEHEQTLSAPDLMVLTGGVPGLVTGRLVKSGLWRAIMRHWWSGSALSGSSAGAMTLFEWRLGLRPPAPLALVRSHGPLAGHVVVPHFDRFVHPFGFMHRLTRRRQGLYGHDVLGIDEQTALVDHDGDQTVIGVGAVTVVGEGQWTRHGAGSSPDICLEMVAVTPDDQAAPRPAGLVHAQAPSGA